MFVLVLLLTGNAVVTIPDYPSEEACEAAGRVAFKRGISETGRMVISTLCVPGPAFLPAE
jgi:hypothetical protein